MIRTERLRKRKLFWYGAAAFLMAVGRAGSLKFHEARRIVLSNQLEALFFFIRLILYFVLFLGIFAGTDRFLCSKKAVSLFFEDGDKETGKPWTPYLVLTAGWLPLILIKYPAAICWDSFVMIEEYRSRSFSEHHSVFYTLIMGKLLDLGESVGHINWGVFAFSVIHFLVLLAAMGWSVNILRKMKITRRVRWAVLFMYLLNPYISGFTGVLIKDDLFAAFIMLFFLCMVDLYLDHEAFSKSPIKMAVLFFTVVNIWLIRKNGAYIMAAAAVLFLIRCFRKKLSKRPAILLIAAVLVSAALYSFLGVYYHAEKGSVREALSVPFQQTARYVKAYGEEVTEEERAAIDAVLPYDQLAEAYKPWISDPVKAMYKEDNSKLGEYFKVWFAQFLKHPMCYVNAIWDQNYTLFVPEVDNYYMITDMEIEPYGERFKSLEGVFPRIDRLVTLKKWIGKEFEFIHQIPFVRMLGNVSFWFYALLFATAIALAFKVDFFVPLALSWFSIVFVVLGPVIENHPRYMFPVVYVMPVTMLFIISNILKREQTDGEIGKNA